MVSAAELTNPSSKNRQLRALAFFQASLTSNASNAIDCLIPVVLISIEGKNQSQFDVPEVASAIKDYFPQLELPLYMVNEIIPKLVERAALKRDNSTHLYIVNSESIREGLSTSHVNFDENHISALEEGVAKFARDNGREAPLAFDNWEQAIIDFFASDREEIEGKIAQISGSIIRNPQDIDRALVASFLQKAEHTAPELLRSAASLYYAFTTYDFFRDLGSSGNKADYAGLSVFYDATVLMRLLGTSGDLLRTATLQMHEALQGLGCQVFYFDHTYNEIQSNLERVVANEKRGQSVYPETQEALRSGEITVGRVAALARMIDTELGAIGITQHFASYETTKPDDVHQIDEIQFTNDLYNNSPNYDEFTRQKDAHSIALIVRLRAGSYSRDVGKSKYIFVTHNVRLASVARRFCRVNKITPAHAVPPVLTLGQMTTLSWLASDRPYKEEEVTKELLANCYKAVLPSVRWEEEFWAAFSSMPAGEDHSKRLQDAIYVDTARRIALEQSFAHPSLVRKIVDGELIRRANLERERESEAARQRGEKQGGDAIKDRLRSNAAIYAEDLSSYLVDKLRIALFVLLFIFITYIIIAGTAQNTTEFWISIGISLILSGITLADYLGLPRNRPLSSKIKTQIRDLILKIRPYK